MVIGFRFEPVPSLFLVLVSILTCTVFFLKSYNISYIKLIVLQECEQYVGQLVIEAWRIVAGVLFESQCSFIIFHFIWGIFCINKKNARVLPEEKNSAHGLPTADNGPLPRWHAMYWHDTAEYGRKHRIWTRGQVRWLETRILQVYALNWTLRASSLTSSVFTSFCFSSEVC